MIGLFLGCDFLSISGIYHGKLESWFLSLWSTYFVHFGPMSVTKDIKLSFFVFFGLDNGHMMLFLLIVNSLYTFLEVVFDLF